MFTETAEHSLGPEADPKVNEESQWVVTADISPHTTQHDERRYHLQLFHDDRHHLDTCPRSPGHPDSHDPEEQK